MSEPAAGNLPAASGARGPRPELIRRALMAVAAGLFIGLLALYAITFAAGIAPERTDFSAYYSASTMVHTGHGARIYDLSALATEERAVVAPFSLAYGVLPYVYPPYFAALLAPLAVLGYHAAYYTWLACNVVLLFGILVALTRYAELPRLRAILFGLASLAYVPVGVCLLQGQVSVLILALLAAALLALRGGIEELAGALLAVALVKPPYVLPLLLLLALRRRWRALGAFVLTAAALAILPLALFGPAIDLRYVHLLLAATSWLHQYGYDPYLNNSLAGVSAALLPAPASSAATFLLDVVALLPVTAASLLDRAGDLAFGLAVVAGVLISPHVVLHDLTLLLLPAAIVLSSRRRGASSLLILLFAFLVILADLVVAPATAFPVGVLAPLAMLWWLARDALVPSLCRVPSWTLSDAR